MMNTQTRLTLSSLIALALLLALLLLAGCSDDGDGVGGGVGPAGELPEDRADWVCRNSPPAPSQNQVAEWCNVNVGNGQPLPAALRNPPPISDLAAKNAYDTMLENFVRAQSYERDLEWTGDEQWRLTGPYVGEIGSGGSYGSHPTVQVFYSPEVVAWMCGDRTDELPDGAMIVKAMHNIDDTLDIRLQDDSCMIVNGDPEPDGWTIIVKNAAASHDGWYWGYYGVDSRSTAPVDQGNPPTLGLAAVTSEDALNELLQATERDPDFYPTGKVSNVDNKVPDVIFPNDIYGSYCIDCHASAVSESTFASLDNVLTSGLQFRQFSSSPDVDLTNSLGVDTFKGPHDLQSDVEPIAGYVNPFSTPLAEPSDAFLSFYDQLAPITYTEAMALSMPAETYDHALGGNTTGLYGPSKYITSDQCAGCHDAISLNAATANMVYLDESTDQLRNLSPYGEWSASPMGLAGRDPIFFAQLQSETNHLPELSTCIQQTCMRCHGVMGSRQLALDTEGQGTEDCESLYAIPPPPGVPFGKEFVRDIVRQWPQSTNNDDQQYAALARDGISCTVCHRVSPDALGDESSFTGNYVAGPIDELYGPFTDDTIVTTPMEHALGITPKFGEQVASADMCGTCHNILLPVFDNDGTQVTASYEQSTHLEWTNSIYGPNGSDFQPCHVCHMATHFQGEQLEFKIANIESSDASPTSERVPDEDITLTARDEFSRHQLHGLNVFLNQMFQQFPLILGKRQIDSLPDNNVAPPLLTGMDSMLYMAENETAELNVLEIEKMPGNVLRTRIEASNKTGHYFPSGVGFRRAFLEFVVRDVADEIIWASGRTNQLGAILNGTTDTVLDSEQPGKFPNTAVQPHYQQIVSGDQVQIYEEVVADSDGNISTSFLRRVTDIKNNRLKPEGFDPAVFENSPSTFIQELAVLPGAEADDPHYTDPTLTGTDVIEYLATLTPAQIDSVARVEVTLYNQSAPPAYLQERFSDANVGPAEKDDIQRLYYLTSHLNTENVASETGAGVISSWKLRVADTMQTVTN